MAEIGSIKLEMTVEMQECYDRIMHLCKLYEKKKRKILWKNGKYKKHKK